MAEPYVLRSREGLSEATPATGATPRGPSLPLEAVDDGAAAVIRLKTPQLPSFLQR